MARRVRELALFNLGIDSNLRGCDLVSLKVRDICHGDQVASRAEVMQHKSQHPVQFEITPPTREALQKCIKQTALKSDDFLFPSRIHDSPRSSGAPARGTRWASASASARIRANSESCARARSAHPPMTAL